MVARKRIELFRPRCKRGAYGQFANRLILVEREGLGPSLVRLKGGCATLTLALQKTGGLGGIRTHT
jgi:hypothetical protein